MKTKGAKRAGRKRKENIKRQPNGQPSRAGQTDKIKSVALEARQRVFNVRSEDAGKPEAGSAIGRAYLLPGLKGISGKQYNAALISADIITTYYRVKGYPRPTPQALDMFRVVGLSTKTVNEDRIKAAEADYMRLQKAMRATDHPYAAASSVIAQAVIEDHDMGNWPKHMTCYLKDTLDAISKEFPERNVESVKKTWCALDGESGLCNVYNIQSDLVRPVTLFDSKICTMVHKSLGAHPI